MVLMMAAWLADHLGVMKAVLTVSSLVTMMADWLEHLWVGWMVVRKARYSVDMLVDRWAGQWDLLVVKKVDLWAETMAVRLVGLLAVL